MAKLVDILVNESSKKDCFQKVRQLIADSKVKDFTPLYRYLFDELETFAQGHVGSVILTLAESQYQDSFVVDKELHINALMIKIINEIK